MSATLAVDVDRAVVVHGNCLTVLAEMADCSVDSIVCDPPYGLDELPAEKVAATLARWLAGERDFIPDGKGFMSRDWDSFVPPPAVWDECLRILKPGGHLLAFAGSRTVDLMGLSIRLAGFEMRDSIAWIQGCLTTSAEILTQDGWKGIWDIDEYDKVGCFDPADGSLGWADVSRVVRFWHSDTAYRLVGDDTDHIVTGDHRCVVERDGKWVFETARTLAPEQDVRIPVLEGVPDMPGCVRVPGPHSGDQTEDVLEGLRQRRSSSGEVWSADETSARALCDDPRVPGVRDGVHAPERLGERLSDGLLLKTMRRETAWARVRQAWSQGVCRLDGIITSVLRNQQSGWAEVSCLEGWDHLQTTEGELQACSVCEVPAGVGDDAEQQRLHSRTPSDRRPPVGATDTDRVAGSSHRPRPAEQCDGQPDAVCLEQRSQALRALGQAQPSLVRIEPVRYDGFAWCVTVPTGAFVARDNGRIFVTGNSSMPHGLDIGKAVDARLGAQREIIPVGGERWRRNLTAGVDPDHERYFEQMPAAPAPPVIEGQLDMFASG